MVAQANIAERIVESILAPIIEATRRGETVRIPKRLEQHVPDRQVREVVGVMAILMMDPM